MRAPEVLVVATGTANTASVVAALERIGAAPRLGADAAQVAAARCVVLPGVGTLGAAMRSLRAAQLVLPLALRVRAGRPTLAICLGLQLLGRGSDESPGIAGLGILPVQARRLPESQRVPQLGWNRVEAGPGCSLLQNGYAYFAHSFAIDAAPAGWSAAYADYGGRFVAGLERGAVLACQFHPELSGAWGQALLQRWLAAAEVAAEAAC